MSKSKAVYFLLLMLFVSLALIPRDIYATAVVWTDKADYEFWETVTIYGSGFNPNTNIDITITGPDSAVDIGSTTSDAFGNFVYHYVLNGIFGTYTVAVTDGVNSASTTFLETRFHLEGYTRLPHAKWTTGVLKGWYECEEVPYRLKMIDVDATTYTISNYHDNDDGGVPGVDYCTGFYVGYEDGSVAPATEVTFSVAGPFYQTPVHITEIYHTWTVTCTSLAAGGTYYLYWKAHLAIGSSGWPGAKLHGKTDATGAQDVPIQTPPSAPIPPPPPAIHLDAEPPILIHPADIGTIMSVEWHEIYPLYCNWYHIIDWLDSNLNGELDYCDYVMMEDLSWYHVEKVTVTLFLISEGAGEPMYIEFEGDYLDFPFGMPISTWWHEVYPDYCNWYHLTSWEDTDAGGTLTFCDMIDLTDEFAEVSWWHVEKVKTDILVTKCPDFGDAPDPLTATAGEYPSLLANDGARHLDWNYEWLGTNVNGELDSKQVDHDEFDDGVSFAYSNLIVPGGNVKITVTVNTSGGPYNILDPNDVIYLNAWIDWNRDGDWQDAGEKIIGTGSLTGTQKFDGPATPVYNIPIPASATPGAYTWLRFRLDYAEDAGANHQPWTDPGLNQEKGAAMYGEVEDYKITIEEAPPPPQANLEAFSQSASPSTVTQGDTVHITVTVKNTGTTTETFDVDLKYDGTVIHTWTGVTLGPSTQTVLTWDWDTSSVIPSTYSITAVVDPTDTIAETDETDNTCTILAAVTIESPPSPPPPPPVGGVRVPINKIKLLAPWIGLASLMVVSAASIVYVKHRKKQETKLPR